MKEAMNESLLHPIEKATANTKIKIKHCKNLFKPDLKPIVRSYIYELFI